MSQMLDSLAGRFDDDLQRTDAYQRMIQYWGVVFGRRNALAPLDCINFSLGHFPEVLRVSDVAAIHPLESGYASPDGGPELGALIRYFEYARLQRHSPHRERVNRALVEGAGVGCGAGTTGSIMGVMNAIARLPKGVFPRANDAPEVVVPVPNYPVCAAQHRHMRGLTPRYVHACAANGDLPTFDEIAAAVTDRTAQITLTYPNNPGQATDRGRAPMRRRTRSGSPRRPRSAVGSHSWQFATRAESCQPRHRLDYLSAHPDAPGDPSHPAQPEFTPSIDHGRKRPAMSSSTSSTTLPPSSSACLLRGPAARATHRRLQGFTLVELMIVVVILGILAAVSIAAFTRYVKRSKTSEVAGNLSRMAHMQNAYFARMTEQGNAGFANCGSGYTPSAAASASRYPVNPTQWEANAGFAALGFSIDTPHYYRYTCGSAGPTIYGTYAQGDIDGDGILSTWEIDGYVENGEIRRSALIITNELE